MAPPAPDFAAQRRAMVGELRRIGRIGDPRVLDAIGEVPREEFVAPQSRPYAYENRALAIEAGQTISQPMVVAGMTEALALEPEDTALEVGTGSGYQAAVLARLCRHVVTIEREPQLAEHAAATLRRLGIDNVEVHLGDGRLGHPALAPYPAILVAAAAGALPPALTLQLAQGGRLVIPINLPGEEIQELRLYFRRGDELTYRVLYPVRFVPLL